MKPYRVSRQASADLENIWDYISQRASPEIATDFIWRFYEAFRSIASSPRAGVSVPALPPGDIRKFPTGNYLIYYRSLPRRILIVRVIHGKRIQNRAFRSRPPA